MSLTTTTRALLPERFLLLERIGDPSETVAEISIRRSALS
jgi:hypothetical protein